MPITSWRQMPPSHRARPQPPPEPEKAPWDRVTVAQLDEMREANQSMATSLSAISATLTPGEKAYQSVMSVAVQAQIASGQSVKVK